MSQNDEGRLHSAPATTDITAADSTAGRGYPRCAACGKRFPSVEYLERHLLRDCFGPLDRPVLRRLTPGARSMFARRLREQRP